MNSSAGANFASTAQSSTAPQGVQVCLEASNDWKIQEIGYDGVEKYIRPETYTDYVGKMSRKVEWRKVVGTDSNYDNDHVDKDEENNTEMKAKSDEVVLPEVGPWSVVAKHLHESLQQLNVLLDDLNVAKNTDYMKPLTVLDPISSFEPATDLVTMGKGSQWIWKRRALQEAALVLEMASRQRQRALSNIGLSEDYISHIHRTQFFEELKKMRDYWRVRKTGDHIYGDLSYNIFGSKYESYVMFDISRRPPVKNVNALDNISVIEVTVPRDLQRRSTLSVSIVKDDITSGNLYGSLDDENYAYMNVDPEYTKTIPWKDSLKWAQNTLLCRDTFNTLCKDAIKMRDRLSIIRDNVLLISLYDDYLLRIELKWHPFKAGVLEEEGDRHLNRVLRELVVGLECTKFLRPQMFIALPVTPLPEALDHRGTKAFSAKEIEGKSIKPQSLLQRLLDIAGHYQLVKLVQNVCVECSMDSSDPIIQFHWLHAGRRRSLMFVNLGTKEVDANAIGKMPFYIHVTTNNIKLETREGIDIDCMRDAEKLKYSFKYCICSYMLTVVSSMAKSQWTTPLQVMHANIHAIDNDGKPAPNIMLCNKYSTRCLLFTFRVDQEPEVMVRKFVTNDKTKEVPKEYKWRRINYKKLFGNSMYKKIELLFSFIKEP